MSAKTYEFISNVLLAVVMGAIIGTCISYRVPVEYGIPAASAVVGFLLWLSSGSTDDQASLSFSGS